MESFIPTSCKKEQVTIRLDIKTLSLIDQISKNNGISRSELINQCVDFALQNMADIDNEA